MVGFNRNPNRARRPRLPRDAQVGGAPGLSPRPGLWPEQDLLTVEDGVVTNIERVVASSQVPANQAVLDDAQLELLGSELARLVTIYPYDVEPPANHTLLLDTEWKLMPDGSLRIKQVR